MDPLTHVLFGGALSATGLGRRTSLATATLVLGAYLPDVDAFSYVAGADAALAHRRGWTHGLLAMAVLPSLFALLVLAYDRWRRAAVRSQPSALGSLIRGHTPTGSPPARASPGWIFTLSHLAVWSHPCLDWLNTYGVRWLMPFDGRWFYGDAVFIADPWLWLLLAGPLFLAYSQRRAARMRWGVLAVLTTVPVLGVTLSQWRPGLWLWIAGLALLVTLRSTGAVPRTAAARQRLVSACLALSVLYILAMVGSVRWLRHEVRSEIEAQTGGPVKRLMVGPLPANPLAREVVAETPDHYRYGRVRLAPRPQVRLDSETYPKPPATPLVEAALGAPTVRGMTNWMRFPSVEVDRRDDGYDVHILDLRYTRSRTRGFGGALVRLDGALEVVEE